MELTQYNTTSNFERVTSSDECGDGGFVLTTGYARGMMQDAIRQSHMAFQGNREQIYFAMEVVNRIMAYAAAEGRMALSKEQLFRGEKPYILDIIESEEHRAVPLRLYLEFGMEYVTCGENPEVIEEFMVNRYYANGYMETEAFTACIYCIGVLGLVYGTFFHDMLKYFSSIIPDSETAEFEIFVKEKEEQHKIQRYRDMCRILEHKFDRWDADKDIVQMDKNSMVTIFNEMLDSMDDESLKELIDKISNHDICCSLLGASEEIRRHIAGLIPFSNRFYLMEGWMDMQFSGEAVEKCMAAMGRVVRIGMAVNKGM